MIIFEDELEYLEGIKKADLVVYAIHREDLINKNFSKFDNVLEALQQAGKNARGKLMITFDGYDNDDREIYLIPEIRDFVKHFYDKCNYLFYFLTPLDNSRNMIFACINNCKSIKIEGKDEVILEITYDNEIKMKTINAIIKYGISQNDFIETKKLLDSFI